MKFLEKILGTKAGKQAWRDYKRRVAALPKDYNIVMNETQSYLWSGAGGMDGSLELLYDILALFETSIADGKRALDVTGNDVTGFVDALVREWQNRTYMDGLRAKYNERIHKQLEELNHDRD